MSLSHSDMDKLLEDRLRKTAKQIKVLREIDDKFLRLEAHRKVLFSKLYLLTPDGNVATKEARVYSSQEWQDFIYGLAIAESERNEQERVLRLKEKAFEAEYATYKIEASAIKRQL